MTNGCKFWSKHWWPKVANFDQHFDDYNLQILIKMLMSKGCKIWSKCWWRKVANVDQNIDITRLRRITASQRNVCFVPSTVTKRFTAFSRQVDHHHDNDGNDDDGSDDNANGNDDND